MSLPVAAQASYKRLAECFEQQSNLSLDPADDLAGASGQGLCLARSDRPPGRGAAAFSACFAGSARS